MVPTALFEGGIPVSLELVVYRPAGPGPFPALVFNHGSTGTGSDPAEFVKTWHNAGIADFFRDRGWIVFFPQRRGRGRSGGLYDEGFTPNRSGYTCEPTRSLAGLERALTDIDAIMEHIRARHDVRSERMIIGGQSRGGILAITYAGTRPDVFLGAINFVGGWMSDQCANPAVINTVSFIRGGAFSGPTKWLYGIDDPYYSLAHSQANFQAFLNAGGHGDFHTFSLGGSGNGHLVFLAPSLWAPVADELLASLPEDMKPQAPAIVGEHLINLSVRAQSGTTPVILGFVISGSEPRPVILRGIGPGLRRFNVTTVAPAPAASLFDADGNLVTDFMRWDATPGIADVFQSVGAFPLLEGDDDAALLATLAPGAYTMHLNDATASGLVTLGELFAVEASAAVNGLANLSARVTTGAGETTVVTGFVIGGTQARRVLIRAAGPALDQFGVTDAIADPALVVFDEAGVPILSNDDWGTGSDPDGLAQTARNVSAFAFEAGSKDAAVVLDLVPGRYTVHVTSGAPGSALVETYAVP